MSKAYRLAELSEQHVQLRQQFTLAVLQSKPKKARKLEQRLQRIEQRRQYVKAIMV